MIKLCRFWVKESDIPVPRDHNTVDNSSLPPKFWGNPKPDRSHDHHFAQLCVPAPLLSDADKKV